MSRLGVAIVTFERLERLQRVVSAIRNHSVDDPMIVVADDGSNDGTAAWAFEQGIRTVTGTNHGVCWNKNRGLYALAAAGCDPLLLLEDDIYPVEDGWDREWAQATARWHHLAYAHPKIEGALLGGSGTPEDPYVNNKATAQCSSISARALNDVGFLDTRFKGYGVGHAEWTTRIKRAGFGFKKVTLPDGKVARGNLYIEGGLLAEDAPSFRDNVQVAANRALFQKLKQESVGRLPWSTDEERQEFLLEQARSMPIVRHVEAERGAETQVSERSAPADLRALVAEETERAAGLMSV